MYALACPLGSGTLCLEFAWQARHLGICKGRDVRPGVPWHPLGSGALCLEFAWQARHLGLSKGPDVRPGVPWRPFGSGALCLVAQSLDSCCFTILYMFYMSVSFFSLVDTSSSEAERHAAGQPDIT